MFNWFWTIFMAISIFLGWLVWPLIVYFFTGDIISAIFFGEIINIIFYLFLMSIVGNNEYKMYK